MNTLGFRGFGFQGVLMNTLGFRGFRVSECFDEYFRV